MTRSLSTYQHRLSSVSMQLICRLNRLATGAILLVATSFLPSPAEAQFDLSEIGYDGFAEAVDDVMVAAFESGRVESVLVKVGDHVKAGQVLAILEQGPQRINVESAEIVAAMRGPLKVAAAERRLHEMRVKQLQDLAGKGNARPEEVERAETEMEMAIARYLNATEEVAQREVELKNAQEQLRRRQVVSPVDGVVAKIFLDPGEFVLPSELTVARVINASKLKAVFNVPAIEAIRLSVGHVVRVEFASVSRSAEGVIETIAPMIDADSGTVAVTVIVDNSSKLWTPGDRCLMDPSIRPKPRRASSIFPNLPAAKPTVIVSDNSVTITDLPTRNASLYPNNDSNRQ